VEGWEKRRQNTEARSQETGFTRLWLGQKREGIKMRSRKRESEKTGKKGKTKKREDGITKTPQWSMTAKALHGASPGQIRKQRDFTGRAPVK
jgi:hypothetical protein